MVRKESALVKAVHVRPNPTLKSGEDRFGVMS
jgi:hypothetical protein